MPNKQRKVLTPNSFLHGEPLETTGASKYPGITITITTDLSWSTYVEAVASRENRTAGFL